MSNQYMYEGWSYERLREQRNRAHFLLEDPYRFVTVLLHQGRLYAIDSPCYHASGPLGEGDIVDVEDAHTATSVACLRCPWHRILVSIETGRLVEVQPTAPTVDSGGDNDRDHVAEEMPSYPLKSHWESSGGPLRVSHGGVVQRTHKVWLDESTGILTIELEDETIVKRQPVLSDRVAGDLRNGGLTMQIFDIKSKRLGDAT